MNDSKTPTPPAQSLGPDLILHPVRMRLIMALGAGAPMSPAQLLERMPDVPPATLYRHLNALRQGGIISVVDEPRPRAPGERRTRGAVERRFTIRPGAASLGPADLVDATSDDHVRWFASFVASLLGAFGRYAASGTPDLVRDGVGYRQNVIHLSDAELASMAAALNAALMPFVANEPAEGRTARLFATILMPADPGSTGATAGSTE